MRIYSETHDGIRYVIDAMKTIVLLDGSTDSDCDEATNWTNNRTTALFEADDFRVLFNCPGWSVSDWDPVGDCFYPTFAEAIAALQTHHTERLQNSCYSSTLKGRDA